MRRRKRAGRPADVLQLLAKEGFHLVSRRIVRGDRQHLHRLFDSPLDRSGPKHRLESLWLDIQVDVPQASRHQYRGRNGQVDPGIQPGFGRFRGHGVLSGWRFRHREPR